MLRANLVMTLNIRNDGFLLTPSASLFNSLSSGRMILFLMIPSLLVDSLTGWMAMNSASSLSLTQLYRLGMFLLIFLWLANYWPRGFILLLALLTFLLVLVTWHSFTAIGISGVVMDLRFNLSLVAHLIYFAFFMGYLLRAKRSESVMFRTEKMLYQIIVFSFYVIAINIVLGIMGIGYSTLESYVQEEVGAGMDVGGKGFFVAGNDLSSVLLIVVGILLIKVWLNRNLLSYFLFSSIALLLAVMLLTKAVILGVMLLMIGIPVSMSGSISMMRVKIKPLIPLLLGLGIGVFAISWLIYSDSAIVRRALYLYKNEGLLTAVTTGRSNFLAAAMEAWSRLYSPVEWLLGRGWSGFLGAMGQTFGSERNVEIDYIDILMMNGLFGLGVTLFVWAYYLFMAWGNIRWSKVARGVLYIDLLLLGLAGASGHVLYSAMNGMFIAILNILPLLDAKIQTYRTSL